MSTLSNLRALAGHCEKTTQLAAGGHAFRLGAAVPSASRQQPQLKQPIQNTKAYLQQVLLSFIGEDALVQINLAAVVRTKKDERGDQHPEDDCSDGPIMSPWFSVMFAKPNLLLRPGRVHW
jgi:hypothetical protein